MNNPISLILKKLNIDNLIEIYSIAIDPYAFDQDMIELYKIELPPKVYDACQKRRLEFIAGRFCAGVALKNLSGKVSQVLVNEDRSPIWPFGFIGSITHTNRQATAVVAYNSIQMLGIDSEELINCSKTLDSVKRMVATSIENMIACSSKIDEKIFYTILFSAKESFFKAIYPHYKKIFDFSVIEMKSINEQGKFALFEIKSDEFPFYSSGQLIKIYFDLECDHVHTCYVLESRQLSS